MWLRYTRGFHIFVLCWDGDTITLDAEAHDTVYWVKKKIYEMKEIPMEDQRLFWGAQRLVDDDTLSDFNIQTKSTLYLFPAQVGGGCDIRILGLGTGGKIEQKINQDTKDPRIWDLESSTLINIQILNSLDFMDLTGCPAPPTPITLDKYRR
ncbi:hypothetical protein FRB95_005909 [Tulasnella sp. JGI-2019a]|nr:hypothetical protein FRB95_005909 [Tulasnella sp. JGI-2019a]